MTSCQPYSIAVALAALSSLDMNANRMVCVKQVADLEHAQRPLAEYLYEVIADNVPSE